MEEMIEVRLFGLLRQYAGESRASLETVLHVPAGRIPTVGRMLAEMGIEPTLVGNLFVNGRLLPRSRYPILLGYPLAAEGPLSPEEYLNASLQAGDRVGVFPLNMGAVVV